MGLEFQSRAFVYLQDGEALNSDLDTYHFEWFVTGSKRQFRHFCAEAKSHSFDAARQVYDAASWLTQSIGFFSITADPGDVPGTHDRSYLLADGFREINTRNIVDDPTITPAGLFDHFSFCRLLHYSANDLLLMLKHYGKPVPYPQHSLAIAGWFYLPQPVHDFNSARSHFKTDLSVILGRSAIWDDQYLFFGDVANLDDTMTSFKSLSASFPSGAGLLMPINTHSLDQIVVFRGAAYQLQPIDMDTLNFHNDVQFNMGQFGYERR